jgi:hypothetical protein
VMFSKTFAESSPAGKAKPVLVLQEANLWIDLSFLLGTEGGSFAVEISRIALHCRVAIEIMESFTVWHHQLPKKPAWALGILERKLMLGNTIKSPHFQSCAWLIHLQASTQGSVSVFSGCQAKGRRLSPCHGPHWLSPTQVQEKALSEEILEVSPQVTEQSRKSKEQIQSTASTPPL